MRGGAAPPRAMIGDDIVAISAPNRLATGIAEEADPEHDVIAISPQRVARARAIGGEIPKEAIELAVVDRAVSENDRHVAIATRACLLERDHWRAKVICKPSPRPPPGA